MRPLLLKKFTATSCIGRGAAATLQSLIEQRSGLATCEFETVDVDTTSAKWRASTPSRLPAGMAKFDCRNNRLAELALQQDGFARGRRANGERWGRTRVGVFLGTSTAGILQTELAYRERDPVSGALPAASSTPATHNSFSVADYVRRRCAWKAPRWRCPAPARRAPRSSARRGA
jgi:3-oxoacyl-[acyl-carrier-protein] synthase-1